MLRHYTRLLLFTVLAILALSLLSDVAISGLVGQAVGSPIHLIEVGRLDIPAKKIELATDRAYVVGGSCIPEGTPPSFVCQGTLSVLDTTRRASPAVIGQLQSDQEGFEAIAVYGNYAYLIAEQNRPYGRYVPYRLAVLDVTTPTNIVEIQTSSLPSWWVWPYTPLINAGHLYVNTGTGVIIYSLVDPRAPEEIGRLDVVAGGIGIEGTVLYVASPAGLYVFDVSNPTAPVELSFVGSVDGLAWQANRTLSVFGGRVYVIRNMTAGCPSERLLTPACGTNVVEWDVSDPRNPTRRTRGGGRSYTFSVAGYKNWLLIGGSGGVSAKDTRLTDFYPSVGKYVPKIGDKFGSVWDVQVIGNSIYITVQADDHYSVRVLTVPSPAGYLPLVSKAHAQGPENRFGIAEADKGGDINWGAQNYRTVQQVGDWRSERTSWTRRVYTGPDVVATWLAAHTPDYYSDGPTHFGPNFTGPVSNGYADPLSDGLDLIWVSANWGDQARYSGIALERYTDGNGHTYLLSYHEIMGPGGHHLHDTNDDDYIDCFDIQYFDPNNSIVTCNGVNQTGPLDGVYIQELNTFYNFVAANPGRTWVIGGEINLPDMYRTDAFMYAIFLRDFSNQIRTRGGTGTKIYLKDVGNLWGPLPGPSLGTVYIEPGTDLDKVDRGDWLYTVAVHFRNLGGQLDGFVTDAGISSDDDRLCWDAANGSIQYFLNY